MIWFVIASNIRKNRLKKITLIMATQRFLKGLHLKRKLVDVIALTKIQKDVDVWLMSTRWWKE
jgi:hypothetical protein